MRFAAALTLGVALACTSIACAGKQQTDPPLDTNITDAAASTQHAYKDIASALCDRMSYCSAQLHVGFQWASALACAESIVPWLDPQGDLSCAPGSDFSLTETVLTPCLNELSAIECGALYPVENIAMEAFAGGLGQRCLNAFKGLAHAASHYTGGVVDASCGSSAPLVGIGAACSESANCTGGFCLEGACTNRRRLAEPCASVNDCLIPYACVAGRCAGVPECGLGEINQVCTRDDQCALGLRCAANTGGPGRCEVGASQRLSACEDDGGCSAAPCDLTDAQAKADPGAGDAEPRGAQPAPDADPGLQPDQ
ncbi:MAG TPA: hypothetical protein VL137_07175 [Polyangiaceae bacterium]|nr:hypothetical protein [Polyangiaceae bacterium]